HPFGALRVSFRGAAGSGLLYGFENRAAIADHAERNVAVLADVAVVEIDLHDGRVGAQTPPITETKIERAADDQNHVGFVERQTTRAIEAVWIARREDAASGAVHVAGNIQRTAEFHSRVMAAASPNLRAK